MILELARYPLWSGTVPIVCVGLTGSFRSSSPRPPAPRRAFFVTVAGFGRTFSTTGSGLSQSSRALCRRPSETGHFYVWGSGLCLGLRSLFAEHKGSGRRTGSSEEPVHLLLHRVENLFGRRSAIDRPRAVFKLPLGLTREPGVEQTNTLKVQWSSASLLLRSVIRAEDQAASDNHRFGYPRANAQRIMA